MVESDREKKRGFHVLLEGNQNKCIKIINGVACAVCLFKKKHIFAGMFTFFSSHILGTCFDKFISFEKYLIENVVNNVRSIKIVQVNNFESGLWKWLGKVFFRVNGAC